MLLKASWIHFLILQFTDGQDRCSDRAIQRLVSSFQFDAINLPSGVYGIALFYRSRMALAARFLHNTQQNLILSGKKAVWGRINDGQTQN
jgi:hypothetical protein